MKIRQQPTIEWNVVLSYLHPWKFHCYRTTATILDDVRTSANMCILYKWMVSDLIVHGVHVVIDHFAA